MHIGQQVGRFTLIEHVPGCQKTGRRSGYRCRCECGNEKIVSTGDIGKTKSCGCIRSERMTSLKMTHNRSRTPEYSVWHMMKDRCHNPHSPSFKYYGARGIHVCERWKDSFQAFYDDMGPRPSRNHSLDRRDNNRGYSLDNCAWSTSRDQMRNRRTTRHLVAFGKSQCVVDWAAEYGMTVQCLFARLKKGVPIEDALTIPLNHSSMLRDAINSKL